MRTQCIGTTKMLTRSDFEAVELQWPFKEEHFGKIICRLMFAVFWIKFSREKRTTRAIALMSTTYSQELLPSLLFDRMCPFFFCSKMYPCPKPAFTLGWCEDEFGHGSTSVNPIVHL
jgi:hypothetical protein